MELDRLAVGIDNMTVGGLDLLQKRQALWVAAPRREGGSAPPGGDVQRPEQCAGAVPDVVLVTPLERLNLDFSSTHNTIAYSGGHQIQGHQGRPHVAS